MLKDKIQKIEIDWSQSNRVIAEKLGCCPASVMLIRRKAGIKANRRGRPSKQLGTNPERVPATSTMVEAVPANAPVPTQPANG